MSKEFGKCLSSEMILQLANKCMQRCLTTLVINKMQISYYYSTSQAGKFAQWVNPEDLGLDSQYPHIKLGTVEQSWDHHKEGSLGLDSQHSKLRNSRFSGKPHVKKK